jgi:hypothetical protein
VKRYTVDQLAAGAGGFSRPSKPACLSYSIPPKRCPLGSKLRGVKGSVCEKCYAHKGMYVLPNVVEAMERRFRLLNIALDSGPGSDEWRGFVRALVAGINRQYENTQAYIARTGKEPKLDGRHFRWHDAGDLQGPEHLDVIAAVCRLTPKVLHMLPTKEARFVEEWVGHGGQIPGNLVIRIGAHMVNWAPKSRPMLHPNIRTCMVTSSFERPLPAEYFHCRATLHKSHRRYAPTCSRCRLCWYLGKNPAFILH